MKFIHYKRNCTGNNVIEHPHCRKCGVESFVEYLKSTLHCDQIPSVRAFFENLKYVNDIKDYLENGRIAKLSNNLYGMRVRKDIPIRIYSCFSNKASEPHTMILLCAEQISGGGKKPTITDEAKELLEEYENSQETRKYACRK